MKGVIEKATYTLLKEGLELLRKQLQAEAAVRQEAVALLAKLQVFMSMVAEEESIESETSE